MTSLSHYLIVAAIVFGLSLAGLVINRRNIINILLCLELMLLAVNINFIAFAQYFGGNAGEVFVFFILTVAAAEAAIGLAIMVVLFRNHGSIDIEKINSLHG